ncbi:GapA-binding peptide SR1P [Paenibacillus sp. ACRRX]|uniref:GapA-binding peptide SR1P n=1 Tax=Paenibacillus TaxID=44249 RepID=UPI00056ADA1E|nr:GapA-binding peptide SR1P [Paenibacillus sp. UMB4589-SE434]MCG7409342.1 GapA-binding peptide SR1P [Paenibacillus sp. ACRRX]MDK8180000.1 GapA-binding peptide SR1P [Paenibacillus sp. UMB4589-SE434]
MRDQINELISDYVRQNDLGTIICRHCDDIIDTLPTNSVKTKYMVCEKEACRKQEGSASA